MRQVYKSCLAALSRLESTVCWIALAVTVAANTAEIIGRTLFDVSFAFAQELTLFLCCWLIFLGAASIFQSSKLLTVEAVHDRLKGTLLLVVDLCIFAAIGVVLVVLIRYGIALQAVQASSTSYVLHIPMNLFSLPVVICAGSMMLTLVDRVIELLERLTSLRSGRRQPC